MRYGGERREDFMNVVVVGNIKLVRSQGIECLSSGLNLYLTSTYEEQTVLKTV